MTDQKQCQILLVRLKWYITSNMAKNEIKCKRLNDTGKSFESFVES